MEQGIDLKQSLEELKQKFRDITSRFHGMEELDQQTRALQQMSEIVQQRKAFCTGGYYHAYSGASKSVLNVSWLTKNQFGDELVHRIIPSESLTKFLLVSREWKIFFQKMTIKIPWNIFLNDRGAVKNTYNFRILQKISQNFEVQELKLASTMIRGKNNKWFCMFVSKCKHLKRLDVYRKVNRTLKQTFTQAWMNSVYIFDNLTKLESLSVSLEDELCKDMVESTTKIVQKKPMLKELVITNCILSEDHKFPLILDSYQYPFRRVVLHFRSSEVDGSAVSSFLKQCPELQSVDIDLDDFLFRMRNVEEMIDTVTCLGSLKSLNIALGRFEDHNFIRQVSWSNTQLERLSLRLYQRSLNTFCVVREILNNFTGLTALDLSFTGQPFYGLVDEVFLRINREVSKIADIIGQNTKLEVLCLRNCFFVGSRLFATDIDPPPIFSAQHLAIAVSNLHFLTHIDLSCQNIHDKCMQTLCENLSFCPKLKILNLHETAMGDNAMGALCKTIQTTVPSLLQNIFLALNFLSEASCPHIISIYTHCKHLEKFVFSPGNHIPKEIIQKYQKNAIPSPCRHEYRSAWQL